MNTILRITRHPLTDERNDWLRRHFGNDIAVVTEDVVYGDDPVAAVVLVIERCAHPVLAVEAMGPEPKLIELANGLAERSIPLIRPVYRRDPKTGRVVVTGQDEAGRDVFAFERYEAVTVETRPALVGKPLPSAAGISLRRAIDSIMPLYRAWYECARADETAREAPIIKQAKALLAPTVQEYAQHLLALCAKQLAQWCHSTHFAGHFTVEKINTYTPVVSALKQVAPDVQEVDAYEACTLGNFFAAAVCVELATLVNDNRVTFTYNRGEGDDYDSYWADIVFSLKPH